MNLLFPNMSKASFIGLTFVVLGICNERSSSYDLPSGPKPQAERHLSSHPMKYNLILYCQASFFSTRLYSSSKNRLWNILEDDGLASSLRWLRLSRHSYTESVYAEYLGLIKRQLNVLTQQPMQSCSMTGLQPKSMWAYPASFGAFMELSCAFCLAGGYSLVGRVYNFASIAATSLEAEEALHAHPKLVGYRTWKYDHKSSKLFSLDHKMKRYVPDEGLSAVVHSLVTSQVPGFLSYLLRNSHSFESTSLGVSHSIGRTFLGLSPRRFGGLSPWPQGDCSYLSLSKSYSFWNHLVSVRKYWSISATVVLGYLWGRRPNESSRVVLNNNTYFRECVLNQQRVAHPVYYSRASQWLP